MPSASATRAARRITREEKPLDNPRARLPRGEQPPKNRLRSDLTDKFTRNEKTRYSKSGTCARAGAAQEQVAHNGCFKHGDAPPSASVNAPSRIDEACRLTFASRYYHKTIPPMREDRRGSSLSYASSSSQTSARYSRLRCAQYRASSSVTSRKTRHGLPAATTPSGISRITTDPEPITVFDPMLTPWDSSPALSARLYVVPDGDGQRVLKPLVAHRRINRMRGGVYAHTWRQHDVIADRHLRDRR